MFLAMTRFCQYHQVLGNDSLIGYNSISKRETRVQSRPTPLDACRFCNLSADYINLTITCLPYAVVTIPPTIIRKELMSGRRPVVKPNL